MKPDAVIFTGGRSSRMGRDKASLSWLGTSFLDLCLNDTARCCERIYILAAPGQRFDVPEFVEVVWDRSPYAGPATALTDFVRQSASEAGAEWLLLRAVDMPLARADEFLASLAARPVDDCDAWIAHIDGRDQPLFGLYRYRALKQVRPDASGSMFSVLQSLSWGRVPLSGLHWNNINRPEDLVALQRSIESASH